MQIYSKNNNPDELRIVELTKSICEKYVVPVFTQEVVVEKDSVPHSHPTLTLNTRVDDERLVLKTLVHEQFHWYAENHKNYKDCILYLKTKYDDDGEHNSQGITSIVIGSTLSSALTPENTSIIFCPKKT